MRISRFVRTLVLCWGASVLACRTSSTSDGSGSVEGSGTSTSGADASGSSSGGPTAVCGNGVVEAGEHCDGTPLAGVECPEGCAFPPATVLWTWTYDGGATSDRVNDVAFSETGVILVGGQNGSAGVVFRVSPEGATQNRIEWSGVSSDGAESVAADGEEVVAMFDPGSAATQLVKFSSDGTQLWATSYAVDNPELATTETNLVVVLPDVTVLFGDADPASEAPGFIARFEGETLVEEIHVSGPTYDANTQLTHFGPFSGTFVDTNAVVLSGSATTLTGDQAWLQRRSLPDTVEWEVLMDSPIASEADRFTRAASAPDQTIAVGWNVRETEAEGDDIWIGKFSSEGELLWSDTWIGEFHRDDYPVDVDVGATGDIYAIGTRSNDAVFETRDFDIVVLKYSSEGQRIWVDEFTGDGSGGAMSWDYAGAVGVHPQGFVVACGTTMTAENDFDMICRALAP